MDMNCCSPLFTVSLLWLVLFCVVFWGKLELYSFRLWNIRIELNWIEKKMKWIEIKEFSDSITCQFFWQYVENSE